MAVDISAGCVPVCSEGAATKVGLILVSVGLLSFGTSGVAVTSGVWVSPVLNKCRWFLRYSPRSVSTLKDLPKGRTCVTLAGFHLLSSITLATSPSLNGGSSFAVLSCCSFWGSTYPHSLDLRFSSVCPLAFRGVVRYERRALYGSSVFSSIALRVSTVLSDWPLDCG